MAYPTTIPGDLVVPGALRLDGAISPLKAKASVLAIASLQEFVIPWTWWRVHDAPHTNLPGTAAADDLALVGVTFGTDVMSIQTLDFGGTSTTAYARATIPLPWNYVAGNDVKLRFSAAALTTLPDTSLTLDLAAYLSGEDSAVSGADLCTTAAKDICSLVFADQDFTITATSLNPGDMLDVRIVMAGTDAGDLGVMTGCVGAAKLVCDVR